MKIAIIADPLDNQKAGVHVFTRELINGIIEQGKGDQLLLIREKKDPALPVEQIAIPNTRLPIGFASLRLFFIIPYVLRRRKDVQAVFEPAHFGPFNLPRRIKRITMIHDLTPLLFPHYHRWHSQILQRLFLPVILRNTNLVLTNSKHTAQDVIRFFPFTKDKVTAVYLGKSLVFKRTLNPLIVNELGLDNPFFICVGTIEPRKNGVLLLEAFKTFCLSSNTKVELVFVGSIGWKSKAFEAALETHPFRHRIKVLGFVADDVLPVLYSHSTGLVYPSEYEGFGLPIIEALACGTAVVAAKNSSLQEIGEGAAFFFDTYDAVDLARQLQKVYEMKERHTEDYIAHAAQFSWSKTAAGVMEAIYAIIAKG